MVRTGVRSSAGHRSASSAVNSSAQPRALGQDIPEDILTEIFRLLPIDVLLAAAGVCQSWRFIILRYPLLWTHLDLRFAARKALPMLSELILLSGDAPFELAVRFTGDDTSPMIDLASILDPHLHRVRALSVICPYRGLYTPLFALLCRPVPLLRHLDVSHGLHQPSVAFKYEATFPVDFLGAAPQLETVAWGAHPLPVVMNRLADVLNLRITVLYFTDKRIFTLFPRLRRLYVDNYTAPLNLEPLPDSHPVQHLELSIRPFPDSASFLFWESLSAQGYTRLSVFRLRNYSQTVILDACEDPQWTLRSLTIDYDDFADAILVSGARECRMSEMAPHLSRDWNVRAMMGNAALLHGLTCLTISLALSHRQTRPALLLPRGCLPALTTFIILCGAAVPNNYGHAVRPSMGTFLDSALLEECGVLDVPSLHTICLLWRGPHPGRTSADKFSVVSPSSLARFISEHVRVDGNRVPVLRIEGKGITFAADDSLDMETISRLVRTIEYAK